MVKKVIPLRKRQAMLTRQMIYRVGLSLIAKKGFYNVTVDDICLAAGISKRTYYSHFKSKDDIVLEQLIKADQFYIDTGVKAIARKRSAPEKLRELNFIMLNNLVKNIGVANVKVAYQTQLGAERDYSRLISEERSFFKIIKEVVDEGQQKGELRTDISSSELTHSLIRSILGLIFAWCLNNGSFDLVREGQKMADLLFKSIQSK